MNIQEFCSGKKMKASGVSLASEIFLMGFFGLAVLPFYITQFGAGMIWIVIGGFFGTVLVWYFESYRLMRYSRKAGRLYTIPGYLRFRFGGGKGYTGLVAALEILILTLVITALIMKEIAKILQKAVHMPENVVVLLLLVLAMVLISLLGNQWIVNTAMIRTGILLVCILFCTGTIFAGQSLPDLVRHTMQSGIHSSVSVYINALCLDGKLMKPYDYISLISLGFIIIGLPTVLMNFFFAEDGKSLNFGKRVSVLFYFIFFVFSAFFGGGIRGYLYPEKITSSLSDFVLLVFRKFSEDGNMGRTAAVVYALGLAVSLFTIVECCLYLLSVTMVKDILQDGRLIRLPLERESRTLRLTEGIMVLLVWLISMAVRKYDLYLILIFLAVLSISMGPVIFLSLVWERMNGSGAVAGLLGGILAVPFFRYAPVIPAAGGRTSICEALGINSVVISVAAVLILIVLVSLITPGPSEETRKTFTDVRHRII